MPVYSPQSGHAAQSLVLSKRGRVLARSLFAAPFRAAPWPSFSVFRSNFCKIRSVPFGLPPCLSASEPLLPAWQIYSAPSSPFSRSIVEVHYRFASTATASRVRGAFSPLVVVFCAYTPSLQPHLAPAHFQTQNRSFSRSSMHTY